MLYYLIFKRMLKIALDKDKSKIIIIIIITKSKSLLNHFNLEIEILLR